MIHNLWLFNSPTRTGCKKYLKTVPLINILKLHLLLELFLGHNVPYLNYLYQPLETAGYICIFYTVCKSYTTLSLYVSCWMLFYITSLYMFYFVYICAFDACCLFFFCIYWPYFKKLMYDFCMELLGVSSTLDDFK